MKTTIGTVEQYAEMLKGSKAVIIQALLVGYPPEEAVDVAEQSVEAMKTLWYPFNHIHEWNYQGLVEYAELWHTRVNMGLDQ